MIEARPATFVDAIELAKGNSFYRRVLVYQVRHTEAVVLSVRGERLALAMLHATRKKRREFALFILPLAARHMPALVRLAHLTLSELAQNGILTFARVSEADARAQRLARIAGFVPGRFKDRSIWLFRRRQDEHSGARIDGRSAAQGPGPAEAGGPAAGRGPGPAAFDGSPETQG